MYYVSKYGSLLEYSPQGRAVMFLTYQTCRSEDHGLEAEWQWCGAYCVSLLPFGMRL